MFRSLYLIGILSLIWVAAQDIVPDDPEVQMQMHAMFYTARVACADENLLPYGKWSNVPTLNKYSYKDSFSEKLSIIEQSLKS